MQNISYIGKAIEDKDTFDILPVYLKDYYCQQNGLIAFHGGLHIRGCVLKPYWHSLGYSWFGEMKLSNLFDCLTINDIPFAQDCFGNQYLIRENQIIRLLAETSELEFLHIDFKSFIERANSNPEEFLNIEKIERFDLKPGQLLNVTPPFCLKSEAERSFKPIDSEERIRFLSYFSRQISNLPNGTNITIETK
jgi:hypothetical protein